ncbi:hypothetical protein [Tomitella gaofuii]|uniref:hypothetical protein n=1 Tax=Tomitella gaofuii TaxID=2760083 RepID=UPI0015FB8D9E|nr:hypothetical protein [Tomitella gaofuii]
MSDPVIEAAQRALDTDWLEAEDIAEAAAREALAPLKDIHRPVPVAQGPNCCDHCGDVWPCETGYHIYTDKELADE